ncbi:MAG: MBL fold metallo-hydrolase [Bacteroidota bacterium]
MNITFLGTGTSTGTPLIGCNCEVCQSDDPRDHRLRSSLFVEVEGVNILIDIGPDFRQQMLRANIQRIDAVLLTHEHNDHIIGLDEIRAFNFLQGEQIPVYASPRVIKVLRQRFSYLFEEQLYPGVPRVELREIDIDQPIVLNGISIVPIQYWHGRIPVIGFRINNLAYLTDFKSIDEVEFSKLNDINTLIISALHHRQHHSHLTLEEAIIWAEKIGATSTYFMHIAHRMGKHIDVQPTLPQGMQLAYDGLII